MTMSWEVEGTDEFADWYSWLSDEEAESVDAAVEKLEELGPTLGRPLVDTISDASDHLKELRPLGGNLRILFRFDPRRTAILLVGGDKTNDWEGWYQRTIPLAESLYDDYLTDLMLEGLGGPRSGPT